MKTRSRSEEKGTVSSVKLCGNLTWQWSLCTVLWECPICNLFTSFTYHISFCMMVFPLINCCLVLYIKEESDVVYSAIASFKQTNLVQQLRLHCCWVHSWGFIVCAGHFNGNINTFLCRWQAGKSGAHHSVSRAFIEGFKPGWDWDWLWNSEAIYLAGTGVVCCILS